MEIVAVKTPTVGELELNVQKAQLLVTCIKLPVIEVVKDSRRLST